MCAPMHALWLALASVQSSVDIPPVPFPAARFVVGWGSGIAAGDLDGDGRADVVTGGLDGLVVLWGDGAGGASRRETLPLLAVVRALALADVDLDGDLDLVTASDASLAVLRNDGAGGFAAPVVTQLGPARVRVLEVAHLDGDPLPDVVVVSPFDIYGPPPFVAAWLGDGQGGYSLASQPSASDPREVAAADFDGDAAVDLAVMPGPQIFLGDGLGGFVAAGSLGVSDFTRGIAASDLNLDGRADLVVTTLSSEVVALLGDGAGGFPTQVVSPGGEDMFVVGDMDGDGRPDVLVRDAEFYLGVALLGDGQGGFVASTAFDVADGGHATRSLALADLDGNGDVDVLARNRFDLSFVLADGAGGFEAPIDVPGLSGKCAALADLDADGDLDVVAAEGGVRVALNDGWGGFGAPIASPGPGQSALALGDFDHDGAHDLLLANYPFKDDSPTVPPFYTQIAFGDGQGKFPQTARLEPEMAASPSVADLDGNGHLDAVFSVYGGIQMLLGEGGGRFETSFHAIPLALDGWRTALGDIDLDGDVDIVATTQGSLIALLRNEGAAQFARPEYVYAGPDASSPGPACLALADLDQDGLVDLAVGYYFVGAAVLWGTLPGAFGPPSAIALAQDIVRARELEVADFDADGRPDLALAYEGYQHGDTAGGLALVRNRGGRRLEWTWSFGPGRAGVVASALGDVDGDGRVDVLASSSSFHYVGPVGAAGFGPAASVYLHRYADEPGCSSGERYCVAKLNSAGCLPRLCSSGTLSASGPDDFHVSGHDLLSNQVAILVWGSHKAALPFGGGSLCVAPPLVRVGPRSSGGSPDLHDCSGRVSFHLAQVELLAEGLAPSDPFCAQVWSRDPFLPLPFAVGLTDALRFVMGP